MTHTVLESPATTAPAVPPRPPAWQENAACRGLDPDIFFGRPDKYGVDRHNPAELVVATQTCSRCRVREECLADALDRGPDVDGVWGGSTKTDRERLTRRIPRVKCPICASKILHADEGWQACGSCGHSWPTARASQRTDTAVAA